MRYSCRKMDVNACKAQSSTASIELIMEPQQSSFASYVPLRLCLRVVNHFRKSFSVKKMAYSDLPMCSAVVISSPELNSRCMEYACCTNLYSV